MRPSNIVVTVEDGNVDKAIKKLARLYGKAGLKREIARHEAAVKPGDARRAKSLRARRRALKQGRNGGGVW